jgi:hypothetical protein
MGHDAFRKLMLLPLIMPPVIFCATGDCPVRVRNALRLCPNTVGWDKVKRNPSFGQCMLSSLKDEQRNENI